MKIRELLAPRKEDQTELHERSWYSYIPGTTDWFRELPGALGIGSRGPWGNNDAWGRSVSDQAPFAPKQTQASYDVYPKTKPPDYNNQYDADLSTGPHPDINAGWKAKGFDPRMSQQDRYQWALKNMPAWKIIHPGDPDWNDEGANDPRYTYWKTVPGMFGNPPLKPGDPGYEESEWALPELDQQPGLPGQQRGQQPGTPSTFNKAAIGAGIDKLDPAARAKFYADLPNMPLQDKLNWTDRLTKLGSPQPGQPQPGQPQTPQVAQQPQQGMRPGGTAQGYQLQQQLNQRGANLATDGIIGPQTKAATRTFQSQNGLNVDGIAGPRTQAAFQQNQNSAAPSQTPNMQPARPTQQPGATPPRPVQPPAQVTRPSTQPPTPLPQVPHYTMNTASTPQPSPAPTTTPLAPGSSNMAVGSALAPKPASPNPQPTTEAAYKKIPKMTLTDYLVLSESESSIRQ